MKKPYLLVFPILALAFPAGCGRSVSDMPAQFAPAISIAQTGTLVVRPAFDNPNYRVQDVLPGQGWQAGDIASLIITVKDSGGTTVATAPLTGSAIYSMVTFSNLPIGSYTILCELRDMKGLSWVTALKHVQIRKLVETGALVLSRFKRATYFETTSPTYPDERLIACRNAVMAAEEARTRNDLLGSTLDELAKVATMVTSRRIRGKATIGVRVGRVINRFKVAKFIRYEIHDDRLAYWIDREAVNAEAALDGIYVIRTNVPQDQADAAQCVRIYKRLARVERAFRSMKTVDLHVRPIRHWLEDRVRAHFFLAMLAYYVEWHMRKAWAPLLFDDEHTPETTDPVAPAQQSQAALTKAEKKALPDGTAVHSFHTLLQSLATVVRNTCRCPGAPTLAMFSLNTTPTKQQERALRLLESIGM